MLSWNDFQANLANCFVDLQAEQDFCDVTLAVDEDQHVQAHRVVLAASSTFFKSMLKRVPHSNGHPVLVMPPQVKLSELKHIVHFIYYGQVTVRNDELNGLMKVANMLKIKGLSEEEKRKSLVANSQNSSSVRKRPENYQPPLKNKRPRNAVGMEGGRGRSFPAQAAQSQGSETMKNEEGTDDANETNSAQEGYLNEYATNEYEEQESRNDEVYGQGTSGPIHGMMSVSDSAGNPELGQEQNTPSTRLVALKCPQCDSIVPGTDAFKQHMATVHGRGEQGQRSSAGQPIMMPQQGRMDVKEEACDICDKPFKNHKSMLAHQKRVHKVNFTQPTPQKQQGGQKISNPGPGEGIPAHHPQKGSASGHTESGKRRGRPPKKKPIQQQPDMLGHEDEEMFTQEHAQSHQVKHPSGDMSRPVQPTSRQGGLNSPMQPEVSGMGHTRPQSRTSSSDEPRAGPSVPRGPMRQQGRPSFAGASQSPARPGPSNMRPGQGSGSGNSSSDLKRSLGLKFGGHISITSSEQSPRRSGDSKGVSIMKYKERSNPTPGHHRQQHQPEPLPVEVKEEPMEEEVEEEAFEDEEEFDDAYGDFEEEEYEEYMESGAQGYVGAGDDSYPVEDEDDDLGEEEEEDGYDVGQRA